MLEALPLRPGLRILEIGCGPGALARALCARGAEVLGLDRSATAIRQAEATSAAEIASGRLRFRNGAIEEFALGPGDLPFDLALAIRVGVLDGRHPKGEARALGAIAPHGQLFLDGGDPLLKRPLPR